jgi:L-alanine-DL-glutamate epimerase-like enolase superfamily enzyme
MCTSKIVKVEIYKLDIPFHAPFRIALGVKSAAHNILVRIFQQNGLYGVGEGAPTPYTTGETQAISLAAASDLARLMLGKDPGAIEARRQEMDAFLANNTTTKCAFDMALYDLLGKHLNVPLYRLLGGEKRSFETDQTIGIDTPTVMAEKAAAIKEQGFTAIKLKLGTNKSDDIERVRLVRQIVGPEIKLRLDANQGWDPAEALGILRELTQFDIQYCEEPVRRWNNTALKRIRHSSPIPIVADESLFSDKDAFRLASMQACDYFNIKLAKSGGLHTALKINAIGEGAGIRCMLGSMTETRLGLTAAAHLVSARPNIAFADLDTVFFHAEDRVIGGIQYQGGTIILPDEPGLGADFESDYLDALEKIIIE